MREIKKVDYDDKGIFKRDVCTNCNKRFEDFYAVQFADSEITHAVKTKNKPLGDFQLDQMFGGGMTIPCGKSCSGDATITTCRVAVERITCKKCLKIIQTKGAS